MAMFVCIYGYVPLQIYLCIYLYVYMYACGYMQGIKINSKNRVFFGKVLTAC